MANEQKDLEKAYGLIQKDRLDEALTILKPITQANPDNADAWWLTANAASEPRDARRALVNVLKLKPKYPKARDLLDKLNEMYPPRDDELLMMLEIEDIEPELPSGPLDEATFDLEEEGEDTYVTSDIDSLFSAGDEEDEFEPVSERASARVRDEEDDPFAIAEDDFATVAEEEDPFASLLAEESPRRRTRSLRSRLTVIAAALALIALLAVILFVFVLGGDEDTTTEEVNVPSDPGDLVSVDAASVSADKAAELESVRLTTEQEAKALVDPSAEVVYVRAENGLALMVRVCTVPGPNIPQLVQNGFRVVAPRSTIAALSAELTMVGVSIQDCTNQDVLYRAMAASPDAAAFTNNSTDYATFQKTWQNIES